MIILLYIYTNLVLEHIIYQRQTLDAFFSVRFLKKRVLRLYLYLYTTDVDIVRTDWSNAIERHFRTA